MEELIKQAFLHVDVIGPHVQQGHYDLLGPDQEIILPQVWDRVIEPDSAITMVMWPMTNRGPPVVPGRPGGIPMHGGPPGPHGLRPAGAGMPGQRFAGARHPGGPPPPPIHPDRPLDPRMGGGRGTANVVTVEPKRKKSSKSGGGGLSFFLGKPVKK